MANEYGRENPKVKLGHKRLDKLFQNRKNEKASQANR